MKVNINIEKVVVKEGLTKESVSDWLKAPYVPKKTLHQILYQPITKEHNVEALSLDELFFLMRHHKPISNKELRHCVRQFQLQPQSCKDRYLKTMFHRLFQLWDEERLKLQGEKFRAAFAAD